MFPLHRRWKHQNLQVLMYAGLLVLAAGFLANRMWDSIPLGRVREALTCALAAVSLAWLSQKILRVSLANALLTIWLIALAFFSGVAPIIAVAFLILSALALGDFVTPSAHRQSLVIPILIGTAFVVGIIGWLLPFAIHYRFFYLLALSIPLVVQRQKLLSQLKICHSKWQRTVESAPAASSFFCLMLGLASSSCWLPTIQFDDLAYHLGMPSQLSTLGYYRLDFFSQLWALAPWAGDIFQSAGQILAGEESRGAIDGFWLVCSATLVWQLARSSGAPQHGCWLASALFCSLPMTAALAGGMQAELPATAVMLALFLIVVNAPDKPDRRVMFAVAVLSALLVATKTGFLAATVPANALLLYRWRGKCFWLVALLLFASLFFVAGSSYFYAYALSGNPLLPLMNGVFHSPYVPAGNFVGTPYTAGGGLTAPWRLTFHTHLFIEGWDGAAGVSFLGLLGAFLASFFFTQLRSFSIAIAIAFLIPFEAINYYRYAYPAMVLMIPVSVACVCRLSSKSIAICILGTLTSINILFQGCVTLHETLGLSHHSYNRYTYLSKMAPERAILTDLYARQHKGVVIFCDPEKPYNAELAGRAVTVSWYDPQINSAYLRADEDETGAGWRTIFAFTNASYAVATTTKKSTGLSNALAGAILVRQIDHVELWELPEAFATSTFMESRDMAKAKFQP